MKLQLERLQFGPLPVVWLTRLPGAKAWKTQADYLIETPFGPIFIPQGFEFDLASVPRPIWGLIAPFELSIVAPLVHDFIYNHAGQMDGFTLTRKEADYIFFQLMALEAVPAWRASLAHLAVRAGGWATSTGKNFKRKKK